MQRSSNLNPKSWHWATLEKDCSAWHAVSRTCSLELRQDEHIPVGHWYLLCGRGLNPWNYGLWWVTTPYQMNWIPTVRAMVTLQLVAFSVDASLTPDLAQPPMFGIKSASLAVNGPLRPPDPIMMSGF